MFLWESDSDKTLYVYRYVYFLVCNHILAPLILLNCILTVANLYDNVFVLYVYVLLYLDL